MLPPFIIEQIRKREEEEAREAPLLELPLPGPPPPRGESRRDDEGERGVLIIDLMG